VIEQRRHHRHLNCCWLCGEVGGFHEPICPRHAPVRRCIMVLADGPRGARHCPNARGYDLKQMGYRQWMVIEVADGAFCDRCARNVLAALAGRAREPVPIREDRRRIA
jgi:hypothetical protein